MMLVVKYWPYNYDAKRAIPCTASLLEAGRNVSS